MKMKLNVSVYLIVKSTGAKPYLGTIYGIIQVGPKADLAPVVNSKTSKTQHQKTGFLSYVEIFKRYNVLSDTRVEFLF